MLTMKIWWLLPAAAARDPEQAKVIFRRRCTACHTFGRGVKVGPDLKGVTERRSRKWLLGFIASSSKVIQSGDPTAARLFQEFKKERMPDWPDLSPDQIESLLDYLAAGGPLQKEPDDRDATTATASEIEAGQLVFHGLTRFNYGGAACNTCHAIRDQESAGGSLGPDLSTVYVKFGDRALADFLRRPCFAREPESSASRYLTPQESFDLKAYLARAAGLLIPAPPAAPVAAKSGVGGSGQKPQRMP